MFIALITLYPFLGNCKKTCQNSTNWGRKEERDEIWWSQEAREGHTTVLSRRYHSCCHLSGPWVAREEGTCTRIIRSWVHWHRWTVEFQRSSRHRWEWKVCWLKLQGLTWKDESDYRTLIYQQLLLAFGFGTFSSVFFLLKFLLCRKFEVLCLCCLICSFYGHNSYNKWWGFILIWIWSFSASEFGINLLALGFQLC